VASPRYRKQINPFVAILITAIFIGLCGRTLYLSEIFGLDYRLIILSEIANLLFGSTVYLFTISVISKNQFEFRTLRHYLPAVFYCIGLIIYFIFPTQETMNLRVQNGSLRWAVVSFIGFALLFNTGYWIASVRAFISFKKELKNEISYSVQTNFFRNFLSFIGLCLFAWIGIYIASIVGDEMTERTLRPYIWICLAFAIMFLTYYGLTEPDLFKLPSASVSQKYSQSKLSTSDLDKLKLKLEQIMIEKKPYLNRKLLKSELAELLGVSNPEIARLLNERIGMSFFEFINYYRIKEFVALAKKEESQYLTMFGIAQEAGFNSKTTFNKSFKKIMGTSPKQYFNKN